MIRVNEYLHLKGHKLQMVLVFSILLGASVTGNFWLYSRYKHLISQKPKKQESYEARELLSDLLSGVALVEVRRIAPAQVILRSPRGAS